jgi:hypothetical protein
MKDKKFIVIDAEYTTLKKGQIVKLLNTYSMVFGSLFYKVVTLDGLEQYILKKALIPYDRFPCSDAIDNSQ